MPKMRARILAMVALVSSGVPAAAAAPPPSPPVFWAGCAGALALKAQRGADKARTQPLAAMARAALGQAKRAANPEKLAPAQIDGVAISAARSFRTELARDPAREAAFEKAVQVCVDAVGKLPGG
jgi:hypothetical protein